MCHPRGGDRKGVLSLSLLLLLAAVATATGAGTDPPEHLVPNELTTGVILSVPQRMIFVMQDGVAAAAYPVGLGRPDWPTFVGTFSIDVKGIDPPRGAFRAFRATVASDSWRRTSRISSHECRWAHQAFRCISRCCLR